MINLSDIQEAYKNIRPFVHETPLLYSHSFSKNIAGGVYLKTENLQKTGSFKVRGAFNKMRRIHEKKIIAASTGNHAQAVAFAAKSLGLKATIVMPETVPIVKQQATRSYGAEVVLVGQKFKEALEYACSQTGYVFIPPFDDDEIIAGQGSIGLEIVERLEDIDFVLVPIGGGGLISGISMSVKENSPRTKVIGVQAEAATSAFQSRRQGKIVEMLPQPTIADAIAIGKIGARNFEIIERYVDDIFLVNDDDIAYAVVLFLERKKLVVEGAGATTLAALIKYRERFQGKRTVLVVSGGNIDMCLMDRIIHKGLVKGGRLMTLDVILDDVPGSLHRVAGIIAHERVNIQNIKHDRLSGFLPLGKVRISLTLEVRDRRQLDDIITKLRENGVEVK